MEREESVIVGDRDVTGRQDLPFLVAVTLGVVAALLVGLTVTSTFQAGLTAIVAGVVLTGVIVFATVAVFELGRRIAVN